MRRDLRLIVGIALWTFALQTGSALILARDLESPNAAAQIARHLVQHGEYAVPAWTVLRGPAAIGNTSLLRAYHLPGEPLYLALGVRTLPRAAARLLHVPLATLLVTSIALVGLAAGGRRGALLAGLLASLDPFILFHGPVWDDTFLCASLEWTVFAGLMIRFESQRIDPARRTSGLGLLALAACAGAAAVTRLQAQLVLSGVAAAALLAPRLRPIRREGRAILLGVIVALLAWGARNAAQAGGFYLGSTHDGITMFRANYATARPSILATGTAEWFDPEQLAPHYAAVSGLSELAADRYFRRATLQYASAHPVEVAGTAGLKLAASLTGFDLGAPLSSRRNVLFAGLNLGLLLVAGYAVMKSRRWAALSPAAPLVIWMGSVTAATTCLLLAIGPVGIRYRIDLTGFTYLALAAVLLTRGRIIRDGRSST
jgi:hypothetical protein